MKKLCLVLVSLLLTAGFAAVSFAADVKIGFLVKQPEESWFQLEQKFAAQCAKEFGFTVIPIGATDGDKVLAALDTLAAQGAKGFVICTPDPKLGSAIKAKADSLGLKYIAVDDRWVDANGNPMADVPYLGISAGKIGENVGATLADQFKKRGWKASETAAIEISFNELQTIKDRTDGAIKSLLAAGFPQANILEAPEKSNDTPGGFDASTIVITKNPNFKHWLLFSGNEESVIGGVRALEGRGFKAADVCAVGINGGSVAVNEWTKPTATGFYGTILLAAKVHGYNTTKMMYDWITKGTVPPADTRTAGTLITKQNWKKVYMDSGIAIPK